MSKAEEALDEVLVQAFRVNADSPITHSNFSKKEIEERNLGQDIPILLNVLPSVVSTTDAGNGVGYTSIRVRGSDASRVNVTLNGIPFNDQESQGSFWVNLPDFASSTENIQLQRGVGTSTNGSGAFGASLNILTEAKSDEPSA
ncbi:TonB-dependent receptor plug domain-containing protein, partial [Aquimarina celericrescens]|nr:TonB-dependent receptor plug domain-containing protein [Aquimarina celericrescens]